MGFAWLLALASCVSAVFRDDAGVADGKFVYLGTPLAVSEHDTNLAVLSDTNVLTVLSQLGGLSWRRILEDHQLQSSVALYHDLVVVGGQYISGYNATDGALVWTVNHPSIDIKRSDDGIIVDSKSAISIDGELTPSDAKPLHQSVIEGSSAQLPNGTLSWDQYGVLKYVDTKSQVIYTRDDGLAYAEKGIFVRPYIDSESVLTEEFGEPVQGNEETGGSFVLALSRRMSKHLSQIYSLFSFIITHGPSMLVLPEAPKPQFEFDQTLVVMTKFGSVYGLNVTDMGSVSWVYHDMDAKNIAISESEPWRFLLESGDGNTYLMTNDGDFVGPSEFPEKTPYESLEISGSTVSSPAGWSIQLPGDTIVGQAIKDQNDVTASVVVPTDSEGSVLYKYLNPFAAAFASYSSESKALTVSVLNTVTGRILAQSTHAEPVVINEEWPFEIAFGEHWIVYTYLSLDASQTPKITVMELYESLNPNTRLTPATVNVYNDTLIPEIALRSWILPSHNQPVHSLALSKSLFGASAREVLLSFEHQVVAVPRLLLSTHAPSTSVLEVPQSGHLSHVYGVSRAQKIVTGLTKLESTYYVATIGGPDLFVTRSSPSGEFDMLNKTFPKVKLVVFVGLLGFAVATMSPLARMKTLQQQWR